MLPQHGADRDRRGEHREIPEADLDGNWAAFAADLEAPFPLVFISCPSAKDPIFSRRYPGHGTIEAVVPVPFAPFASWAHTAWKRRGSTYDALKARLRPARPIRDLYLTGPDVGTCGVTGALAGALTCASAILRRNLFRLAGAGGRQAELAPVVQQPAA
ncbi:MAG: hypothetical protein HYU37_00410, partial [Acidobacteria bacterium]|nr:hypothetical protein [Acidobacteriota bacterium]